MEGVPIKILSRDILRWPEPICMLVGYVFEIAFFGRNDLTDFYEFWHP